jgi:hypothetical protein
MKAARVLVELDLLESRPKHGEVRPLEARLRRCQATLIARLAEGVRLIGGGEQEHLGLVVVKELPVQRRIRIERLDRTVIV